MIIEPDKWMKVPNSTNLRRVRWDGKGGLVVEFTSGEQYHYTNVPAPKVASLLEAPSAGAYFHREIKGVHEHKKLEELIP